LIQQLQGIAKTKRLRITFLSGDVHCAAVGVLKTLSSGKNPNIAPATDYRYMINVVTSAIVNTPSVVSSPIFLHMFDIFLSPPASVIGMVSTLATKTHRTLHHAETDEIMV